MTRLQSCAYCADDRGHAITASFHSGISYGRKWALQDAAMTTYYTNLDPLERQQDKAFADRRYVNWLQRAGQA